MFITIYKMYVRILDNKHYSVNIDSLKIYLRNKGEIKDVDSLFSEMVKTSNTKEFNEFEDILVDLMLKPSNNAICSSLRYLRCLYLNKSDIWMCNLDIYSDEYMYSVCKMSQIMYTKQKLCWEMKHLEYACEFSTLLFVKRIIKESSLIPNVTCYRKTIGRSVQLQEYIKRFGILIPDDAVQFYITHKEQFINFDRTDIRNMHISKTINNKKALEYYKCSKKITCTDIYDVHCEINTHIQITEELAQFLKKPEWLNKYCAKHDIYFLACMIFDALE